MLKTTKAKELTEGQELSLDCFVKLLRASESVVAALRGTIAHAGLTEGQFAVMDALLHLGPLRTTELAKKLMRSNANLTTVVDNLSKLGYVERRNCAVDRRCCYVDLTTKGRTVISHAFGPVADQVTEILSVLSPAEQRQLAKLTKKLGLSVGDTTV